MVTVTGDLFSSDRVRRRRRGGTLIVEANESTIAKIRAASERITSRDAVKARGSERPCGCIVFFFHALGPSERFYAQITRPEL